MKWCQVYQPHRHFNSSACLSRLISHNLRYSAYGTVPIEQDFQTFIKGESLIHLGDGRGWGGWWGGGGGEGRWGWGGVGGWRDGRGRGILL